MTIPAPSSNRRGIIMMLSACALIAVTTILAKWLGTGDHALHPFQVTAGRFCFALIALAIAAAILRPTLTRPNMPLYAVRVLAGWSGVTLMFAAVTVIPVADATAISFLNPIFGMMLAIPLLGEKVGRWRWFAAAIGICGGVILLRPGPSTFDPGALIALTAAVIMGLEVTIIKLLTRREAPMQILLMANTMGSVIAITTASFVWITPSAEQWLAMAALGLTMLSAQVLYLQAIQAADASFVLPFSYATLVFAAVYDRLIFGATPDAVSYLGIAVILAGAGLLAWREARLR